MAEDTPVAVPTTEAGAQPERAPATEAPQDNAPETAPVSETKSAGKCKRAPSC
jgi:hypothetical protein